jgi:MarR family 2-MHQ and catechol resistance regulon transcriptional repressor
MTEMLEAIQTGDKTLNQRVRQMTSSLLALRRLQDKNESEFLASLGGLSMPQLNVLNIIGDSRSCTMGEIAKRAALSLSSVTVIVDKLVKLKLVERIRSEEDRRIVEAKLSVEGFKIYQIQIDHINFTGQKMFSVLTEEEQNMLLSILEKLVLIGGALKE